MSVKPEWRIVDAAEKQRLLMEYNYLLSFEPQLATLLLHVIAAKLTSFQFALFVDSDIGDLVGRHRDETFDEYLKTDQFAEQRRETKRKVLGTSKAFDTVRDLLRTFVIDYGDEP